MVKLVVQLGAVAPGNGQLYFVTSQTFSSESSDLPLFKTPFTLDKKPTNIWILSSAGKGYNWHRLQHGYLSDHCDRNPTAGPTSSFSPLLQHDTVTHKTLFHPFPFKQCSSILQSVSSFEERL